jgi:predicted small secreted protein
MKTISKLAFTLISMLAISILFTGCNTAEGLGKDVQNLGDKIEDSAK